jgi:ribonuclease-3
MESVDDLIRSIPELEEKLHYTFQEKKLLVLACSHSSFVNENRKKAAEHNERIEFLGDSVLGMIVCEFLFEKYPEFSEGKLSTLKAKLIDAAACHQYIDRLMLNSYILLGKGEMLHLHRSERRVYSNFFEAIVGAIFLDGGYASAKNFFLHHFKNSIEQIITDSLPNFKASLQEYSQEKYHTHPQYLLVSESGPEHEKSFTVDVYVNQVLLGQGSGKSKKIAEQAAAEVAMKKILGSHG